MNLNCSGDREYVVDGAETTVEGLFSFELVHGRFGVKECGWCEQERLRAKPQVLGKPEGEIINYTPVCPNWPQELHCAFLLVELVVSAEEFGG
jgi:hypothetical protein